MVVITGSGLLTKCKFVLIISPLLFARVRRRELVVLTDGDNTVINLAHTHTNSFLNATPTDNLNWVQMNLMIKFSI